MLDPRAGQQPSVRLHIFLGPHVFSLCLVHCLCMSVYVKSLANIKL